MLDFITVFYLLSVHFIADFVFQTNEMAVNKSKSNYYLSLHVMVYSLTLFFLLMPFVLYRSFNNATPDLGILFITFVLINGLLHYVTDYVTSRLNAFLYKYAEFYNMNIDL